MGGKVNVTVIPVVLGRLNQRTLLPARSDVLTLQQLNDLQLEVQCQGGATWRPREGHERPANFYAHGFSTAIKMDQNGVHTHTHIYIYIIVIHSD